MSANVFYSNLNSDFVCCPMSIHYWTQLIDDKLISKYLNLGTIHGTESVFLMSNDVCHAVFVDEFNIKSLHSKYGSDDHFMIFSGMHRNIQCGIQIGKCTHALFTITMDSFWNSLINHYLSFVWNMVHVFWWWWGFMKKNVTNL